MFQSLVDLLTDSSWAYLILFAIAAGDAVFPALPSEAAAITAGVLAARGHLDLALVVAAAAGGAITGDNVSHLLGRQVGAPLTRRLFKGKTAKRRLDWAREQLRERGGLLIVVARFIPGGRTATTFSSGLLGYRWWKRFLPFSVLAGLAWALYAVLLGYFGGRVFEENVWYALVFAFALAGALTLVVEGVRRARRALG